MKHIQRIDDLEISIGHDEIAGLLGYKGATIPERVQRMITEIERIAPGLVEPATAYRIMTNDEYSQSPFLHHIDQLAMCLVTIGERLEGEVQRQKEKGELGRALLFDAFGSAVAEATADAAETIIQGAVAERGLRCSQRFSPGYSGWRVDEQEWILPALDGQSLGVALTEGCMMCPRKSITFAMTIGDHPVEVRTANICDSCGAVNCPLRHTPHNCFGKTFE